MPIFLMTVVYYLLHMLLLLQGYRCRKAYIATQGPMVETTEDFWRMLWEHNCSIVVMMTKVNEMGVVCACHLHSIKTVDYISWISFLVACHKTDYFL